ncbi:Lsr2 family protein [Tessaracoccus sp. SD287]|uniref:histone-like nucleoid-structuring protein Lsr2 n=1 Tax=Tessaracoccus sp. SD287 TaxID=2782008 RepID=UPI001A9646D6|nr:Lsr2 family protein [Tessaracoccus sp. SD287]MBO1031263.1 Lsr2 family protein [Tessaracoccus sp. SD287]
MVQRTILVIEDDLDGGDAVETVSFALDGVSYDIDLNEANAAKLRDSLAVWIGHARRTGGRSRTGSATNGARRGRGRRSQGADIRAWAQSQGMKVSERGRVSKEVVEAYEAAHA